MHCVFCFCFYGWFSASLLALVDIETEPVFLAAAVDSVLGILGDGGGDKENRSAVRIHRAWTPTLCSPARQPEAPACGADVAPILRPQSPPRARGWLPALPTLRDPNQRVPGRPGTRRLWPGLLPSRSRGTAPSLPRHSRGAPGAAELGLRTTVGTWARPQRCARHRRPATAPAGGERDPPPRLLCTSPREFAVGDAHP